MKRFWLINLALFQLSWYAAAFFTAHAAVIIACLLLLHFAISPSRQADLRLLLLLPLGVCADGLQLLIGSFSGAEPGFPLWLLGLWSMLIISLNHSLKGLERLSGLSLSALGAVAGASSYYAGVVLGALQTSWSDIAFLGLTAAVWSGLLPLLVYGRRRLLKQAPDCLD